MPLSEDEQRILSEIETQLRASDPDLAHQVGSTTVYTESIRKLRWGVVAFIATLALAITLLSVSLLAFVVGFLGMFAAALFIERNTRDWVGPASTRPLRRSAGAGCGRTSIGRASGPTIGSVATTRPVVVRPGPYGPAPVTAPFSWPLRSGGRPSYTVPPPTVPPAPPRGSAPGRVDGPNRRVVSASASSSISRRHRSGAPGGQLQWRLGPSRSDTDQQAEPTQRLLPRRCHPSSVGVVTGASAAFREHDRPATARHGHGRQPAMSHTASSPPVPAGSPV